MIVHDIRWYYANRRDLHVCACGSTVAWVCSDRKSFRSPIMHPAVDMNMMLTAEQQFDSDQVCCLGANIAIIVIDLVAIHSPSHMV